ncbi:MAG: ABC transporter ATP-binding protein [Deltaproteobacteria bacterium]|nr:ABC transporter ATP-binding protein [Deltaproteobacteria bacterium]
MTLISVENLCVSYQTKKGVLKAVDDISFELEEGRSLGFVGESGCGKTTLGMALMRLLPENGRVTRGRILYGGQDLVQLSDKGIREVRWNEIAMIFQAAMNALNPVHRVDAQLREAIATHEPGISKEALQGRVEALFDLVEMPRERMRAYPHQFSGGMKQRAVIAMALACNPKLVIADEPTTALDVIVQDQILQEIRSIQDRMNISVIFISHDIAVVANVCHDIAVMYAGQIVEFGSREEVFNTPIHPYTRLLLTSYLTLEGDRPAPLEMIGRTPDLIAAPTGCRFYKMCPHASAMCENRAPEYRQATPTHRALCSLTS